MWLTATLTILAAMAASPTASEICHGVCVSAAMAELNTKLDNIEREQRTVEGITQLFSETLTQHLNRPPPGFFCPPSQPKSCYMVVETPMRWFAADTYCMEKGGHLVFVESEAEHQFLKLEVEKREHGNDGWWIGLSDMDNHGTFSWYSATEVKPLEWSNWDINQPDNINGKEHFGEMWMANKKWNDRYLDWDNRFICEFDKE